MGKMRREANMKTNVKLLAAIRERGMRQVDFAWLVRDHPTFVSRVINGWINLDEPRKIRYARALGVKVEEIFPKTLMKKKGGALSRLIQRWIT